MRVVGGVGLTNYFFLCSFFFLLLSGQEMVLVTSGFVHGMSPMGGPAVGSVVGLVGSLVVLLPSFDECMRLLH